MKQTPFDLQQKAAEEAYQFTLHLGGPSWQPPANPATVFEQYKRCISSLPPLEQMKHSLFAADRLLTLGTTDQDEALANMFIAHYRSSKTASVQERQNGCPCSL